MTSLHCIPLTSTKKKLSITWLSWYFRLILVVFEMNCVCERIKRLLPKECVSPLLWLLSADQKANLSKPSTNIFSPKRHQVSSGTYCLQLLHKYWRYHLIFIPHIPSSKGCFVYFFNMPLIILQLDEVGVCTIPGR
jgi:hypothetical protein